MTWNRCYQPPDSAQWQGRPDLSPGSCFFQLINMLNLMEAWPTLPEQKKFALLGFCCDEGIRRNFGRPGAIEGPDAIRQMLAKLPMHRQDIQLFDAGNITCTDGNLEASQAALSTAVAMLLAKQITPIVLGGGHEVAFGHYQGIAQTFPEKNLGIINFDAHFDMRPMLDHNKGSSGTPFLQIAEMHHKNKRRFDYNCVGIQHTGNTPSLLNTAKQFETKILWADELHLRHNGMTTDFTDRIIDQNEMIYLSLCLDVFASAFAPGVSATQPLGLYPWHVIPLIRELAASGKVVSFDIAELSPKLDIGNTTARLAAMLIYEFIHHYHKGYKD